MELTKRPHQSEIDALERQVESLTKRNEELTALVTLKRERAAAKGKRAQELK